MRPMLPVEDCVKDTRHALRLSRHSPVFTTTVLLSLALGIGANTAIFTLVDFALFRTPSFPQADRLVHLWETGHHFASISASCPDFED